MTKKTQKRNTIPIIAAIITSIGLIIVAGIGGFSTYNTAKLSQEIEFTRIALDSIPTQVTQTSSSTPAPTFTPTPTPIVCPYLRATDDETITALIQAEAIAAQKKDMSIIGDIFDPDANFYDHSNTPAKEWHGAQARYEELFATVDFRNDKHFDILPVGTGILGDVATYTSGSQITYRVTGDDWIEQTNGSLKTTDFGSEHWILKKNTNGCWVIAQMEFNSGHVKFPEKDFGV